MGQTTIAVNPTTLERFNQTKRELDDAQPGVPDHNADSFLNALLDTWEKVDEDGYGDGADADTDPITHNDLETPADVAEIAQEITDELTVEPDVGASLTYDDVVQACRAAVREELPVEDLAR